MSNIPCAIYRAGTSKVAFFVENDLPIDRDPFILRIFGSPDPRQIDGIGGGDPLTSKAAYIAKSSREGVDLDYTAAYVSPTEPLIDYQGNCGNSAAAVLPFAILRKLIKPTTSATIYNTNTQSIFTAEIEVRDGEFYPGTPITLNFMGIAGTLPTGNPIDTIQDVEVSIVDAFDTVVFVRAKDLTGSDELESILPKLHQIRKQAADLIDMPFTNAFPKIAVVGPNQTARTNALTTIHKAYPVTGAICLGIASQIPGTIPSEFWTSPQITINHPSGQINVTIDSENKRAMIIRTSRLIMDGIVYY